jgi:inositol phosphorylceramide mannosyltransferase catalytic subunit
MQIPKIIHQTWKDHQVPDGFRRFAATWKKKHTDWKYLLWTDEMNRNFIKEKFPDFLSRYDSYTTNIQRVDAVRYFILYKYGGVFVDLDFECCRNIVPLLRDNTCVFGKESHEHCTEHNKDMIISNAFMAATSGNSFFASLCTALKEEHPLVNDPYDDVLETTGPFMLSRVYENYERKDEITLVEEELLYPLSKRTLTDASDNKPEAVRMLETAMSTAYAIHHYVGTWYKTHR